MKKYLTALLLVCAFLFTVQPVSATVINFDDQGLTGPSIFAAAGPEQVLSITTTDGLVTFEEGVILENTANLPANQTALYGTAYFGDPTLDNPLEITFSNPIANFFLDVYNGLTSPIDYRVYDNLGNTATFTLAPNLTGGTTQIGFAATGTTVWIESITPPTTTWDFFIDNIQVQVLADIFIVIVILVRHAWYRKGHWFLGYCV